MVRLESVRKVYYECRHDIVEKFIICKSRINRGVISTGPLARGHLI